MIPSPKERRDLHRRRPGTKPQGERRYTGHDDESDRQHVAHEWLQAERADVTGWWSGDDARDPDPPHIALRWVWAGGLAGQA